MSAPDRNTPNMTSKPLNNIENFAELLAETTKDLAPGTPVEIWFQDEARVGQKNGLVYQWAKKDHVHASPGISAMLRAIYSKHWKFRVFAGLILLLNSLPKS